MDSLEKQVLRILGLAVLHILASPIYIYRAIVAFERDLATFERVKTGVYPCTWCKEPISLVAVATCPECRATTPGSLLRCQCGASFDTVTCPTCSCTVKVR